MSEVANDIIELDSVFAGYHITIVCEKAADMADEHGKQVHFNFNGTDVLVSPGEAIADIEKRWDTDRAAKQAAYLASDEYKQAVAKREEEERIRNSAVLVEKASTEQEMRDAENPWPRTEKQLVEYIDSLVKRPHEYGTCVYAMSLAAVAAFNYIAGKVGATGFQSGCADLDVLRRTRRIDGPFMILKSEDALYPQYDLRRRLDKSLSDWTPWLKEQATQKLTTEKKDFVHPDVWAHWESLADG